MLQESIAASSATPAMDDPYYETRQAIVAQINRDRAANGVAPVEFDALSSRVSDQHCQEMAARQYLSHWNLRGLLPYHRYHLAGADRRRQLPFECLDLRAEDEPSGVEDPGDGRVQLRPKGDHVRLHVEEGDGRQR